MSGNSEQEDRFLRGEVVAGELREVQERYRALAHEAITGACKRILIVGTSHGDPLAHAALKDLIYAIAVAGAPQGLRLALVARSPDVGPVFDAAVAYARIRLIDARRVADEASALEWLRG